MTPPLHFQLARRVRLRLWVERQIDRLAIRLIDYHYGALSERIWRLTGLWEGKLKLFGWTW